MHRTTTLLVIDMQLCAFDGKLLPPIVHGVVLLDKVAKLITAAREAEVPITFVQHRAPEGRPYAKGTHGWEIHPSISPEPTEAIVYKTQSSAFDGTDLQRLLAVSSVNTIIACGIQSEFCVTNTSISALELGFDVCVAQDAHGTLSTKEDHASAIVDRQNALLFDRGARLQRTSALVELFATSP